MESVFCTRLKMLMHDNNLTDKALERELGLPKDSVYNWTHGVTESYNKYLSVIAERFNVSVDFLLGNDPMPAHRADDKRLVSIYWELTPEGRDMLMDYAEFLQERYSKKNNTDCVNEVTG